ncbi:cyclodeaminase/cyclohydrolase family protein [Nakamurella flava]|uniref:Cyclodeaminase/cyclohydrolase family protein n=1 Tax=Nakamurella flava TaxID=2576308 RepID=A0A4U6QB03_9ACTN|nr:cyclodeaminase/cyclohydrolase family protein [Nakamurella flava]
MRHDTIDTYLKQLADRVPTPGGGATAALHAAQAAALVAMVGRYSDTAKYAEHADRITAIVAAADELWDRAAALADADVDAFGAVGAAYERPKSTDDEVAARKAAIADALAGAGRVPAQVIAVAGEIVALAEVLAPIGNRNVISDVAAAADAARAAATTGRVNVEINLAGLSDPEVVAELTAAIAGVDELARRSDAVTAAVRAGLSR